MDNPSLFVNKRLTACVIKISDTQGNDLSTGLHTAVYTSFTVVVFIKNKVESYLSTFCTMVNDVVKRND